MNTKFTLRRKQAQNEYFVKKWRNLTLLTAAPTLVAIVGTVVMWRYTHANNYQTDLIDLLPLFFLTILAIALTVITIFCLFRLISEYRNSKE